MEIGKSSKRPSWTYKIGNSIITTVDKEKDLGIVMQDNLSPEKHINKIFGDTICYIVKGHIVAFHYMDKEMMKKIITTMIRPKLEYAAIV